MKLILSHLSWKASKVSVQWILYTVLCHPPTQISGNTEQYWCPHQNTNSSNNFKNWIAVNFSLPLYPIIPHIQYVTLDIAHFSYTRKGYRNILCLNNLRIFLLLLVMAKIGIKFRKLSQELSLNATQNKPET